MKALTLTLCLLAVSVDAAHASQNENGYDSQDTWQAHQPDVSQTRPRNCSIVQGQQAYINACGELVPSIYDTSPVSDY